MEELPENLMSYPSETQLREHFIGKKLHDIATPAAIVDRAVVMRNCKQMLMAIDELQVSFRPHVKTHKYETDPVFVKTTEVAQMQVGNATNEIRIVVSTAAEAEHLLPYLLDSQKDGKSVNVLYGIPLPPSQVHKLAHMGRKLGLGSVSVLVDNIAQLSAAQDFKEISGFPIQIFIKIDTGYHRAGLPTGSNDFYRLVKDILALESRNIGKLVGFYSHAGHSYGGDSSANAMKLLIEELEGLERAATEAKNLHPFKESGSKFILSVGATPTVISIENLQQNARDPWSRRLLSLVRRLREHHTVELHAGVYPFLDLQQLATNASPSAIENSKGSQDTKTLSDVALSILLEVASIYAERDTPEALIAAGTLALGREPCKSYDGWGIVSDWGMKSLDSTGTCGWKVGRISQEHSILTRHSGGTGRGEASLRVGQKLRVWPNHACVASAGFSWYIVVDSSLPESRHDEIVDFWVRCRGW